MATYQLCKPLCVVIGVDIHAAIAPVPPFYVKPAYWLSIGTTVLTPAGDMPSDQVKHENWGVVKRGSDCKYLRNHLSIGPPPVTPVVDCGLVLLHTAFGSTKTAWGPYSIRAHVQGTRKNPAIIFPIPWSPVGFANQLDCSSPCRLPSIISIQGMNTVLVGYTLGDFLGNLVDVVIDLLVSYIQSKLLKGLNERVGEAIQGEVTNRVLRILLPALASKLLGKYVDWQRGNVADLIAELADLPDTDVSNDVGEAVAEWVDGQYH